MSKVTLERVIEDAKSLTPEEQRKLREALDKEARTAELRRIQSKYAHLITSSEDFAARKAEEIELEDRRRQP
ncbi:MAG TPA: hypothetical protein VF766_15530 [Pyrinomonadaceae bacterium]